MVANELKNNRDFLGSNLTRAIKGLQRTLENKCINAVVRGKYNKICDIWDEIKFKHNLYVAETSESTIDDAWINNIYDLFDDIEMHVLGYLEVSEYNEIRIKEQALLKARRCQSKIKFDGLVEIVRKLLLNVVVGKEIYLVDAVEDEGNKLDECTKTCEDIELEYLKLLQENAD